MVKRRRHERSAFEITDAYRWPLFILLVGAFFDGLTTYQFLQTLGPEVEVHPVQQLLFTWLPPLLGVLLAKTGQVVAAILLAAWWRPWCRWIMLVCGVIYG
ncbi:MAG: hypothetical protein HY718_21315, partial [Planctomycetes bacterium]|nr:hypothetical protein [Planctomycetota bacterium]